ncbi:hypothetical protein [Nocardia acidivorans]|uniref:hypothetical protein n=1 Tax=Nocardia acidivorans TaxID=404580 RepID=UPI000A68AADE|nr:hypothetical protein [Nocardia acidivorans]
MQAQQSTAPDVASRTAMDSAIELVRAKAPETRFGRLTARPIPNSDKYIQVNRVDAAGVALSGGWTFLVDVPKQTVVRTAVDPDNFDVKSAVRHGMVC